MPTKFTTGHCLRLLVALLLYATTHAAVAQQPPVISVITFEPGTVYWERFGHDAILVQENGQQVAYNYGIFDFHQKNFFLNFALGRMQYQIAAQPLRDTLYPYVREKRWALEQTLALSPDQATELADFLAWNARPENAQYHYDYFIANCSTKVRDALNKVLSGELQEQLESHPSAMTYRQQVVRVSAPEPWLMLGMDVGLGPAADKPLNLWQESFLPGVLARALRQVKLANGQPLVASERMLLPGTLQGAPTQGPLLWPWFAGTGLLVAFLLLVLGHFRQYLAARITLSIAASVIMLACGLGGVFLACLWGFTEHWAVYRNQNLLLLNPLCLLLLPLWLTAARRSWRPSAFARGIIGLVVAGAIVALLLHLLPGVAQANLRWIAAFLPVHLALFYYLRGRKVDES